MSFLEDLVGIKNVVAEDGTILPRRHAISFIGAAVVVEDDIAGDQTVVRIGEGLAEGELLQVDYELPDDLALVDTDGVNDADVIRLISNTGGWRISGISIDGLTQRRKILVNVSAASIVLGGASEGVSSDERLRVPEVGITLPFNGAIEVVWLPDDGSETYLPGWYCL